MTTGVDSLITLQEVESVVNKPRDATYKMRTLLMIILGALMVVIATLLILLILSLKDSRTGLGAILPFLDSKPLDSLQTN